MNTCDRNQISVQLNLHLGERSFTFFMETSRLLSLCLAAVVTVIVFVNSFSYMNSSSSRNEQENLRVKLKKRLPDAVIIGVKKCGTTTLGQFLNHHPSIAATGEISFFENYKNYLKGPAYYVKQMPYARYSCAKIHNPILFHLKERPSCSC